MAELETSVPTETPTGEPTGQLDGINPAFKEAGKEPAQKTDEQKAAAAMRKLKIKGEEIEVDETKYHEYAQKGAAATKTWEEAAKMRKEVEAWKAKLKSNAMEALRDPSLGIDFDQLAEEAVWQKVQAEREKTLPPEQRALLEANRIIERQKEAEAKAREESETKASAEARQKYAQEYDEKLAKALGASGIPKNTRSVRRMIDYILNDHSKGIERDMGDYVEKVEQDYLEDIQDYLGGIPEEKLIKVLGDKIAKRFREADVKRIKTTTPQEGHTFVPGKGMVKQQPTKKLSGKDWERDLMKSFLGR